MADADQGLEQAKAKLDSAVAALQGLDSNDFQASQVVEQQLGDALYIAQEALVAFRRDGNTEKKVEALHVVVQAHLGLGADHFAALTAAQDELAMTRKSGDKNSIAKILDILLKVHIARQSDLQALDVATELVDLYTELGNKQDLATALRQVAALHVALNRPKLGLEPAQKALALVKELGDKEGEDAALRTLSSVYSAQGIPQKAPNRPEADAALADLQVAIEQKDAAGYASIKAKLDKTCAYIQKDIDDVVKRAMESDESGTKSFMADQGVGKRENRGEEAAVEVIKRMTYINFRIGGLGYGPRFRCLQAHGSKVKGLPEKEMLRSMKALAVLQVSDEAEDWEKELGYQPGILDGMLQSLTGMA